MNHNKSWEQFIELKIEGKVILKKTQVVDIHYVAAQQ